MKAYISVSYSQRHTLRPVLDIIGESLKDSNIEPFIFIDQFQFAPAEEKEMMDQALAAIDNCGLLIAETSDKAIGIGIEAGYAKARQIPIIYVRNKNAEHSTTLSGISDYSILYDTISDLQTQLQLILKSLR